MATKLRNPSHDSATKGEDALQLVAARGASWATRRRPVLLGGLALAGVAAVATALISRQRDLAETAANADFAAGLTAAVHGVIDAPAAAPDASAALAPGDGNAAVAAGSGAAGGTGAGTGADGTGVGGTGADGSGAGSGSGADAKAAATAAAAAAAPADGPPHFASEADRWRAAQQRFAAATARMGQRGVGAAATLMEGEALCRLGEHEAAMGRFATLAAALPPASPLFFLAVSRLAEAREARGELDAALAALTPLAGKVGEFYGDYAESDAARLLVAKGDVDAARIRLEHLEQGFPNSPLREEATARLAALAAAAPPAAPPATP